MVWAASLFFKGANCLVLGGFSKKSLSKISSTPHGLLEFLMALSSCIVISSP